MKKTVGLLILFVATVKGFSNCPAGGLYYWPTKHSVCKNSVFIIDGYGLKRYLVEGLGTTQKACLKSKEHTIRLIVQEILPGQFSQAQAILKPEVTLMAGQEYELIIEGPGAVTYHSSAYNPTTGQAEKMTWTVSGLSDNVAPIWLNKPAFKNFTYEELTCGHKSFANFSLEAGDSSEFVVRTCVKNSLTGKEMTYYLTVQNNSVAVGQDICWGAFSFRDGESFEVEFSLLDASGNITKPIGERIVFKKAT